MGSPNCGSAVPTVRASYPPGQLPIWRGTWAGSWMEPREGLRAIVPLDVEQFDAECDREGARRCNWFATDFTGVDWTRGRPAA